MSDKENFQRPKYESVKKVLERIDKEKRAKRASPLLEEYMLKLFGKKSEMESNNGN